MRVYAQHAVCGHSEVSPVGGSPNPDIIFASWISLTLSTRSNGVNGRSVGRQGTLAFGGASSIQLSPLPPFLRVEGFATSHLFTVAEQIPRCARDDTRHRSVVTPKPSLPCKRRSQPAFLHLYRT